MACGTGIEGCGEVDEGTALHAECMADPRRVWRGLVFEVDSSGDVLWHRIDSFNPPVRKETSATAPLSTSP